jgi:hypothetical protein
MNVRGGNPGIRLKKVNPPACVALIASRISLTDDVVFSVFRCSDDELSGPATLSVRAKELGDS